MGFSEELHKKCEQHRLLAIQLSEVKEKEMELRLDICSEILKGKKVGTNNFTEGGLKIKAVKKVNHKLDEDELSEVYDDMSDEETACIKFKPSLIKKNYDALAESPILDEVLTVEDATPSLKITLVDA